MTSKSALFLTALAVLAAAAAGCSDLGLHVELSPHPEVSTLALDFGTVTLTDSASRTVTVRNTGLGEATGNATIGCAGFQIVSGGGPFTLRPGGSRDIVIHFRPAAEGDFSCSLELGPTFPSVSIVGSAAFQPAGARCEVSTTLLDFGTASIGQTNLASFQVSNTGTAPLLVDVVSACPDFLIVEGGGTTTITPGLSKLVRVAFNPLEGGRITCSIAVGPGCPSVGVTGFATTVSYARDVQPIYSTRGCNGCHVWNYNNTVGVEYFGDLFYIAPGDTAHSVIYGRISGNRFGQRMPPGGPFVTSAERARFATWILEGALNN